MSLGKLFYFNTQLFLITMRKTFIIATFATITLIACNNNKSEVNADGKQPKTEATHAHDDGSVHNDHDSDTIGEQEQFKVEKDSTDHGHAHEDSSHKH